MKISMPILWLFDVLVVWALPSHGRDWWARDLMLLFLGFAGGYLLKAWQHESRKYQSFSHHWFALRCDVWHFFLKAQQRKGFLRCKRCGGVLRLGEGIMVPDEE